MGERSRQNERRWKPQRVAARREEGIIQVGSFGASDACEIDGSSVRTSSTAPSLAGDEETRFTVFRGVGEDGSRTTHAFRGVRGAKAVARGESDEGHPFGKEPVGGIHGERLKKEKKRERKGKENEKGAYRCERIGSRRNHDRSLPAVQDRVCRVVEARGRGVCVNIVSEGVSSSE